MTAWRERIERALRWRLSEAGRELRDVLGAMRYAVRRRTGSLVVTPGVQAPGDRIAIYTVFPLQGLQASHLHALHALNECGYATLVVSNAPLTDFERGSLVPLVWQIVERPNFGYDFGAYREGIRIVAPRLAVLKRLILLNDSVWFPLPGGGDWPLRAEGIGVDMVGAVSNCGVSVSRDAAPASAAWSYDGTRPDFHYCSFALSFGPRALNHPRFSRFWARIRLTDDKFHTVRRGEVALSRTMIDSGLSHAETFDVEGLGARLAAACEVELHRLVRELVIPEDHALETFRQRVLAEPEGPHRRERFLAAALRIIASTGPAYALPAHAYDVLGHPFLKKSPLRLSRPSAEVTLRLTARLVGSVGRDVHSEARSIAIARFGNGFGVPEGVGERSKQSLETGARIRVRSGAPLT